MISGIPDRELRLWPFAQAGEAARELARAAALPGLAAALPRTPDAVVRGDSEALDTWLGALAPTLGLFAQSVSAGATELGTALRQAAPALLAVPGRGLVTLLGVLGNRARVLTPELRSAWVPLDAIRVALSAPLEQPHAAAVSALLARAGLRDARAAHVYGKLMAERLRSSPIRGIIVLRAPGGGTPSALLREVGLVRCLATVGGAYLLDALCTVLAFVLLGQVVLGGRLDTGWMLSVILLLVSAVPLQLLATSREERLAAQGGVALKQRLLEGVLRSRAGTIVHGGIGKLLGLVLESDALEGFATSGGIALALAGLETLITLALLAATTAGRAVLVALLPLQALLALAACAYHARRREWTASRLALSSLFIEALVGQRTRLAQESPTRWHELEDQALSQYHLASRALDRCAGWLGGGLGRGGLILGLAALAPGIAGGHLAMDELGLCLYSLLTLTRCLDRLGLGGMQLSAAALAAGQLAPLLGSAPADPPPPPIPLPAEPEATAAEGPAGKTVLWARDLTYRAAPGSLPVLRGCALEVRRGERLLLLGPSGGGKSTLASILAGLRQPTGGVLLAGGLDLPSLGPAGWRRRISLAPQYHENWVFSATLAFNLLMGRWWPPTPQDLQEAEQLCQELGLGPLLARMPAGLHQMLGETGWRLSHGERSRLFLARALLQGAELVILDESFAALDPETLQGVARCVLRRAPALLAIAHP